jgi:hypothetical protein
VAAPVFLTAVALSGYGRELRVRNLRQLVQQMRLARSAK